MLIKDLKDFSLPHTFECGQCFRWNLDDNNIYTGVVGNRIIKAYTTDEGIVIECDDDELVTEYFDLARNYTEIKNMFADDIILNKACDYGYGIRLLKQNPWETMISFIISANNNIPRIKKIINSLCNNFGQHIFDGHYTFPTPDVLCSLTVDDLDVIKSGFRAKYILDAAKKVASGELVLEELYNMDSADARAELKTVKGIGDKVADCVLLFAYQKFDVFPKDVWIKRILNNLYNVENSDFENFISTKFGNFGGFAQQYLFYYGREFI